MPGPFILLKDSRQLIFSAHPLLKGHFWLLGSVSGYEDKSKHFKVNCLFKKQDREGYLELIYTCAIKVKYVQGVKKEKRIPETCDPDKYCQHTGVFFSAVKTKFYMLLNIGQNYIFYGMYTFCHFVSSYKIIMNITYLFYIFILNNNFTFLLFGWLVI